MDPFLGEIRMVSFDFAPEGWAGCDGQQLPIRQNQALFALLGNLYGGNGVSFALPDLRDRAPIQAGNGHILGERGGEKEHTLSIAEMPSHTHTFKAYSEAGNATAPAGTLLAKAPANLYGPPTSLVAMNAAASVNTGGGRPHPNMQPYLTLTFCIALQGIFPTRDEE